MHSLDDYSLAGKRVLLRLDLNIETNDVAAITTDYRVQAALPTLRRLLAAPCKIIVLAHRGRPDITQQNGTAPDYTTPNNVVLGNAVLAQALSQCLHQPVHFVPAVSGSGVTRAVEKMHDGEILLLENIRFDPRETTNGDSLAAELAQLADLYVNDAFANCHRAHASIVAITRHLPSAAGPLLLSETAALQKAFDQPVRPLAAIIGGAKISTKLGLLEHIITRVDMLLVGGAMANTFLAAEGINVQRSFFEPDLVPIANHILNKAHQHNCQIVLPHDVLVAPARDAASAIPVPVSHVPAGQMILDIGPATLLRLQDLLGECRTVLWNGPLGLFENTAFARGTVQLAQFVAARTRAGQMTSIAGGGDTVAALNAAGVMPDFSYVSTAGGAFLEYLEGKALPGLTALASQEQV